MHNSIQHTFYKSHVYLASYIAFANICEEADRRNLQLNIVGFLKEPFL